MQTYQQNMHNILRYARESKVLLAIGAIILCTLAGLVTLSHQGRVDAAAERDYSDNSIIRGGFSDMDDFAKKVTQNSTGDLDNIFGGAENARTLKKKVVKGTVYKDGRVVVNGKTVGTNAFSLGRQYIPGSTKQVIGGKTYYYRPTKVSFAQNSLEAYVVMENGRVGNGAILTACGNPVAFTPQTPVAPTKPTPRPTPTPTPKPTPPAQITVTPPAVTIAVTPAPVTTVAAPAPASQQSLPKTGAGEAIASTIGIVALVGTGLYWLRSRQLLYSRR